ncbi:Sodium/calcium exchanger protein-domain-containing protein [Boletus reticuloceps]|uniref:Sodium/calcium exchanger protein-domain-containing protein n=1 Tax=Boletus reticuloceps TaxID=495285 RepID=A0A8I3A7C3_9AGAM|nr:Sodium/calcium exchanger protein-domain-containing protein [Boletus reticuloceps]
MSSAGRVLLVVCIVVQCVLWSHRSRYHAYHDRLTTTLTQRSSDTECQPRAFELAYDQCVHVQDICPTSDTVLSISYLQLYYCAEPAVRPLVFTALLLWLVFLFSTLGISASDFFTPNLAAIAQFLGLNEDVAGVTLLAFGNASPDVFATFSAMRTDSGALAIGELLGAASFIVSCVAGSICIIRPFKVDRIPFLRDVGFFTIAICILLVILIDGVMTTFESTLLVAWYVVYAFTIIVTGWWVSRREKRRRIEAAVRAEYMNENQLQPYSDGNTCLSNQAPLHAHFSFLQDPPPSPSSSLTVPIATRPTAPLIPRLQTQLLPAPRSRTPSPVNSPSHQVQMPSFSLAGAIEFRQVVASLQSQATSSSLRMFDSPVTPYAGGHYHVHRCQSRSRSISPRLPEPEDWDKALGVPLNDRSPKPLRTSISEEPVHEREQVYEEQRARTPLSIPPIPSITHTHASPTEAQATTDVEEQIPSTTRPQGLWHVLAQTWHTLFPSLHHFGSKTLSGKMVSLLAAPAVTLLTITLPVVITPYGNDASHKGTMDQHETHQPDFQEEDVERVLIAEHEVQEELHEVEFNKWLTAVQCVLGPLFCVAILFSGNRHIQWILAGTALGGSVLALLVFVFSGVSSRPAAQMARCSMGFLVSIMWIMAIADEVVNLLQTFGFIFGLSDAIIGLTIFAVGNSLADLVANTSIALFAPMMGFSACFGGPMVNILLGIGISCTLVINESGGTPYTIHFTPTLIARLRAVETLGDVLDLGVRGIDECEFGGRNVFQVNGAGSAVYMRDARVESSSASWVWCHYISSWMVFLFGRGLFGVHGLDRTHHQYLGSSSQLSGIAKEEQVYWSGTLS